MGPVTIPPTPLTVTGEELAWLEGLRATAQRIAAEVRHMDDHGVAELHVAVRAEAAARPYGRSSLASGVSMHVAREAWRLARH